ncbi:MAG TPA: hypothetical protein VMT35_10610 [Ignavibacteriaceae bacterium]|nr:hypothetical protein [Ignavibacteriaceae bacterium]
MKKIFSAIVILICSSAFSQVFTDLYKDHIPENIIKDKILSSTLEINLQRDALLQPELIYLVLKYFRQYDENNFNKDLFNILKSNERIWLVKREQWAAQTLNEIRLSGNENVLLKTERDLEKLDADIKLRPDDKPAVLDKDEINLRDFLIVKFYRNSPELEYNSAENYSLIRNQVENDKKNYFSSIGKGTKEDVSVNEFFDNVINNWYLLIDNDELKASGLLLNAYNSNQLQRSKAKRSFSFLFGNVFFNQSAKFEEAIEFPDISEKLMLNKKFSIPQNYFGLGYKLFLKDEASIFSYVEADLSFSIGYAEKEEKVDAFFSSTTREGNIQIDENFRNFNDAYKLNSLNSSTLKIITPLLQYNYLSTECGVSFSYNTFSYEPDLYFIYSKYRTEFNGNTPILRETVASGSKSINTKIEKKYFSFIPVLDLSVFIIPGTLGIKASGSYNFAALNLFYNSSLQYF